MIKHWLIISLFLACALSPAHASELKLLYSYAETKYAKIFDEFTKDTGIAIDYEFRMQDDLKTQTMSMIESGDIPDAIIMPADHLGLHDFTQYSEITPSLFNVKLPTRIWETTLSDGKYYGVPLSQGNHLMLYYNKALIAQPAISWDELIQHSADLKKQSIHTIVWNQDEAYWFLPFLGAFEGWLFNQGEITLNSPAMIKTLEFYKKIRSHEMTVQHCDYTCTVALFKSGKVAYSIDGDWASREFRQALGNNLAVAPLPSIDKNPMIATFSAQAISFPNNGLTGPKRELLITLTNYLQSTKAQLFLWEINNSIPVEPTALAIAKKTSTDIEKNIITLMDTARPLPAQKQMTFIWDALAKGFTRHREGALDSENTAAYMQYLAIRHIRNAQKLSSPQKNINEFTNTGSPSHNIH